MKLSKTVLTSILQKIELYQSFTARIKLEYQGALIVVSIHLEVLQIKCLTIWRPTPGEVQQLKILKFSLILPC